MLGLKKSDYYSLKNILKKKAMYNVIFGPRSNGKTFAVLEHALAIFTQTGKQLAIVRRWPDDLVGKRGQSVWANLVKEDKIRKYTKGEWSDVWYYNGRWYLAKYDEKGKRITQERPIAYGFAVSTGEHDKSSSYPDITTIFFDEFIARGPYLQDEFVLTMHTFSTIIRQRKDVTIFMAGNSISPYCPYFREMGIKHVKEMDPGDIDLYTYGTSGLTVAVEYAEPTKATTSAAAYFAFDNPKLQMITGGKWELDIYPHLPEKYSPKDVLYTFYFDLEGDLFQAPIIQKEDRVFIFIHPRTKPLPDDPNTLVYSTSYSSLPNWRRRLNRPTSPLEKLIALLFQQEKVFYADNPTGEAIRQYLEFCGIMR